mgnify:CR=1 FL=1
MRKLEEGDGEALLSAVTRKGEVVVPQVEKKPPATGGPPLRFESKPQTQRGGAQTCPSSQNR